MVNFVFAFDFQYNFFPIFKALENPSDKRMLRACLVGLLECAIPYLTVGFLGYLLAGARSSANFLESIDYDDTNGVLYFTLNVSYIFSIFFAIVLCYFGTRNNLINIINIAKRRYKNRKSKALVNN